MIWWRFYYYELANIDSWRHLDSTEWLHVDHDCVREQLWAMKRGLA